MEDGVRNPRGHLVQRLQDCLDPFGFPGPETQGAGRGVPTLGSNLSSELPHVLGHGSGLPYLEATRSGSNHVGPIL